MADTWAPPEVAEPPSTPTAAPAPWTPPEAIPDNPRASVAPTPTTAPPGPNWANYYGGLDGIDNRLSPEKAQALKLLDTDPNPKEARARAINQVYVSTHLKGMDPATIRENWQAVKDSYAKNALGIDSKDISDTTLYGKIADRFKPATDGKPAGGGSFWDALRAVGPGQTVNLAFAATSMKELPEAPHDLPNINIPGIGNPAVIGGVYNAMRPFIAQIGTPASIPMMGGSELLSMAREYPAAKAALMAMSGGFAALMGPAAVESAKRTTGVVSDPNASLQDRVQAGVDTFTKTAMTVIPALHVAEIAVPGVLAAMKDKPITEAPEIIKDAVAKADDISPEKEQTALHAAQQIEAVAKVGHPDAPPAPAGTPTSPLEPAEAAITPTTPPTPPKAGAPTDYGIAERVSDVRGKAGQIDAPEAGEGIAPATSVERGRTLLSQGANPEEILSEFNKTNRFSSDDLAVLRARGEELAQAASETADKFGVESPEYKAAAKADSDWTKAIKPVQTEWAKAGAAQQGSTDIDTGDFHSLATAFKQISGRDFTPEEAGKAEEIAAGVKDASHDAETAKAQVIEELKKKAPARKVTAGSSVAKFISEQAEAARARIKERSGRIMSGLDPVDLTDHAIVGADYIAKGVTKFADWSGEMVKEFGEKIKPHLADIFKQANDRVDDSIVSDHLAARKASLEARIKKLSEKIESGDLSPDPTKANRPEVAELEKLAQQRDSLQAELGQMRETAKKVEDLEKAVAEKERKIKEGNLSTKGVAQNRPSVESVEKLKQQRDALNRELTKARTEAKKPSEAEQIAKKVEAIKKTIAEKKEQLRTGDIEAKGQKVSRPEVGPIEEAKQELDRVNKDLADARKAARDAENAPEKGSVADVWQRAKDYLEAGEDDFDDLRHKIAADTGLPVSEVTKKLAGPKKVRVMTNEMYSKMSKRRDLIQQANYWLKQTAQPGWQRLLSKVPRAFFTAKVFGHGTVGMITHAGINMFDPTEWGIYWPEFVKQYKMIGWHDQAAFHERAMQDLSRDRNYVTARRAGLANSVTKALDDYEKGVMSGNTIIGKLGMAGNRGFDTLKIYRQARFNQTWDALTPEMRTPEMAKLLADDVNHSTGYVKANFPKAASNALFAPKLEASRWAFLAGDSIRDAKTFADWKTATPEERLTALSNVKRKAIIAGTYLTLLAANQGLLEATDSKQKVNFTNPRKPDFLAFKGAGYELGVISPTIGLFRYLSNMVHASLEKRAGSELKDSRAEEMGNLTTKYIRAKLSPFASVVADVASQADYQGRPLPFSSDKLPSYLRKEGVDKYSYREYIGEHVAPIPVEDAIHEVWGNQGMSAKRINDWMAALAVFAIVGGTGARVSKDTQPEQDAKAADKTGRNINTTKRKKP